MSEPTQEPPASPPVPPAAPPVKSGTWLYTLAFCVVLVACGTGYYLYEKSRNPEPPPVDEGAGLKEYLAQLASEQKLAPAYTDADGDLVADRPTDPGKFVRVDKELTFSVVGTADESTLAAAEKEWADFLGALGKATGKTVKYARDVPSVDAQLSGVREGKLHITAFNTGAVPTAVNTAGFVPLFVPANDGGEFGYTVEILVRANSPITEPAQLKGKTLGFVALSSNSGAKAPMVALKEQFGLLPGRDYKFVITGDHKRSIKELAAGKHDAVCVASDLMTDLLETPADKGGVSKGAVKSIYSSKPYPQLCFGVPHNLSPDLQKKIEQAFESFQFAGTSVKASSVAQGRTRFNRVSYKTAWAPVREIDSKLTHLLDEK